MLSDSAVWKWKNTCLWLDTYLHTHPSLYVALINRADGLYGRILTEVISTVGTQSVCTHDQGQDSSIQTDLAWLIRCLLWQRQEQFNSFNVTGLYQLTFHKWWWAVFNSSKVCSSSLLFFFISFLAHTEINIIRQKQSMILHFSLQHFCFKTLPV